MHHVVVHVCRATLGRFPENVDQNKATIGCEQARNILEDLLLLRFFQMMDRIAADDQINAVVGLLGSNAYYVVTNELMGYAAGG